jgi:hypothetical protein
MCNAYSIQVLEVDQLPAQACRPLVRAYVLAHLPLV